MKKTFLKQYPKSTAFLFGIAFSILLLISFESILRLNKYEKWFNGDRRESIFYNYYSPPRNAALEHELKTLMRPSIDSFSDYPTRSRETELKKEEIDDSAKISLKFDFKTRSNNKNLHFISQITTKQTGRIIYKVPISTDAYATRTVPNRPRHAKEQYIFSGDSFIFGEGVTDGQTMPAYFQKLRPELQVYNMGIGADSPSGILHELQFGFDQRYANLPIRNGTFFYFYISEHLNRIFAPMSWLSKNQWILKAPWYEWENNKSLAYKGMFRDRYIRNAIFSIFNSLELTKFLGIDWPIIVSPHYLNFFVEFIKEIKNLVTTKLNVHQFYFVFHPQWSYAGSPILEQLLKQNNIEVIDLRVSDIYQLLDHKSHIPVDHHPSPLTHEFTAIYLNKVLKARALK